MKPHRSSDYRLDLPDLAYQILDFNLNALPEPKDPEILGGVANKCEDADTYYKQYQPLILEETTAVLRTALEKRDRKTTFRVQLQPGKDKLYYHEHEKATVVVLIGENRIDCMKEVGSPRFIVSAVHDRNAALRLAIIDISFTSTRITVKGDLEYELRDGAFEITPLASLINLDRMYSTCEYGPDSYIFDKIRRAEVDPWPQLSQEQMLSVFDPGLKHLNLKQAHVVASFTLAQHGLFLLQGPPGTGKTTTIVQLIRKLAERGERILVCAPSNKAVQVLAKRSMQVMPWLPMLLVGVESKIDGELKKISFDSWLDRHPKKLMQLLLKLDVMGVIMGEDDKHVFSMKGDFNSKFYWALQKQLIETIKSIREIIISCFRFLDPQAHNLPDLHKLIFESLDCYQTLIINLQNLEQKQAQYFPSLSDSLSVKNKPKPKPKVNVAAKKTEVNKYRDLMREAYNNLFKLIKSSLLEKLPDPEQHYAKAHLLELTQILFCTMSTSGRMFLRNKIERQAPFDTVIFDEAGQAVEVEALIPSNIAPNPRKMILVGDPRQLPATTIARSSQETNYEWSMLWRLMEVNKQPVLPLDVQYRMRSAINHFPSQRYYEGNLKWHVSIADRPMPLRTIHKDGYNVWIDVHGREEPVETSFMNRAEADCVQKLVAAIRQKSGDCSIGIISFYSGQVSLLRKVLAHYGVNEAESSITISSVDGFQGDEKDIIIISAVRANDNNSIGFTGDFRRLNVAITRARDALVICGNVKTFSHARLNEVQELLNLYRTTQLIKTPQQVIDRLSGKTAGEMRSVKMPSIRSIGDVTTALERSKKKKPQRLSRQQREQAQPLHKLYDDEQLFTFARQFAEKMQYETALERCQTALQVNPERYDIYEFMAECSGHLEQNDHKQMYLEIAKTIKEELKDPSKRVDYVPPKVVVTAAAAPSAFVLPKRKKINVKAALNKIRKLSDAGKRRQAEAEYRALLIEDETNPEIMIGLGWTLNKLKRFSEARNEFERSLTVEQTPLAYFGLIVSLRCLGCDDEAVDKIYECIEMFPYFRKVKNLQVEHEKRNRQRSFRHLSEPAKPAVAKADAAAVAAEKPLTKAAHQKQKPLTAFFQHRAKFQRVTKVEIERARDISQRQRNPGGALVEYKKLLAREPKNWDILSGMAWCHHHLRNNEEAIPLFEKCLEIQQTAECYYGLIRSLWYGDRRSDAHDKIAEYEGLMGTFHGKPPSAFKRIQDFKKQITPSQKQVVPGGAAANPNGYFKQRKKEKPNSRDQKHKNQTQMRRKQRPGR